MTAELKYVLTQMDEEESREEKISQAEIDDMVKTSNLEGNRKINFDGKNNVNNLLNIQSHKLSTTVSHKIIDTFKIIFFCKYWAFIFYRNIQNFK